jgi:DNA invertase Pin-like site-specific DNA recombinase
MIIGYAFASHKDPSAEHQIATLRQAHCDEIVVEQTAFGHHRQDALRSLLVRVGPTDVVVVTSLDRIGRSLPELLAVLQRLDERTANFRSLAENLDTTSAEGRVVFRLSRAFLQAERAMLIERTQAGREEAKRKGEKLGRKPKMSADQVEHARQLLKLGESGRSVARTFGISEATLYRRVRQ